MKQELSFSQASAPLAQHLAHAIHDKHLLDFFQEDKQRQDRLSIRTPDMFADYSRQRILPETWKLLVEMAHKRNLAQKISAMFHGDKINSTENRSVLHVALRAKNTSSILVDSQNIISDVQNVLAKIKDFSQRIHDGKHVGVTGKKLCNILAIGIGGSYLGPECLALACAPYAHIGMSLRFVANVDGTDFTNSIRGWNAEETLVIIISKTFTTAETMHNARTARAWLCESLPMCHSADVISKHCIAVSTAKDVVRDFGIDIANMFEFWDWVGGRFSVTSAVGAVPLSLYLGYDNFQKILDGANWMDNHFQNAPFEQNIPIMSGLIDIWNINFLGFHSRALLPYSQGLARLPAYTQQGEMESNGKCVDIQGIPVPYATGEIVFGEPGTNGQHSFYQLLHQGTQIIPADFIAFVEPEADPTAKGQNAVSHHEELLTNFLAQPDALAFGKKEKALHKNFPGNRPSSSYLLQKLTPYTAGLLIAWTEHRTAVKGFIWGINSFDQFGVQLGKTLGTALREKIISYHTSKTFSHEDITPATQVLLQAILNKKLP